MYTKCLTCESTPEIQTSTTEMKNSLGPYTRIEIKIICHRCKCEMLILL